MVKQFFSKMFQEPEAPEVKVVDRVFVETQSETTGTSGTEIFTGYYNEEYLVELSSREKADVYDKMRRSDARVIMNLSAVKNPMRSAPWEWHPASDDPKHIEHAALLNHIFDHELHKTKNQIINEAASVVDFGHAVFERTHKVVLNHPEFGSFNSLDKLMWISPKTIEQWFVERDGTLRAIRQCAQGDLQQNEEINAKFLTVISMNKEGDNYDGISMLRPCYGPYLRKNVYAKLNAIGIEKHAIPTPVATTPEGLANKKKMDELEKFMKAYTLHQKNFLITPAGYTLDLNTNTYDPEKVTKAIEHENKEMTFAFLANFLTLGGGGATGSFSLSNDLSDFFLNGILYIADTIGEEIDPVGEELTRMNFGPQDQYPKFRASGIADKAGAEFAKMMKDFADAGFIKPDNPLEQNLRKRIGLPEFDEEQRELEDAEAAELAKQIANNGMGDTDDDGDDGVEESKSKKEGKPGDKKADSEDLKKEDDAEKQLSEMDGIKLTAMDIRNIKLAESKALLQIKAADKKLEPVFEKNLEEYADRIIKRLMINWRDLPDENKSAAIANVNVAVPGKFRKELKDEMAKIGFAAIKEAQKEVPKAPVKLDEFDDLPLSLRKYINTQSTLLAITTAQDTEKSLLFTYSSSVTSTDDGKTVEADLNQKKKEHMDSPSVQLAATNTGSKMVNEARSAYFFEPEVLKEIETFTFSNPAPKSAICQNLWGKTFRADDKAAERYFPPLHHNCKSYLSVNLVGLKDNPDITDGGLQPDGTPEEIQKAEKSISLR